MNRREILKFSLFAPLLGLIPTTTPVVPETPIIPTKVNINSTAARVELAEQLLRLGYITTPEEYMAVIDG